MQARTVATSQLLWKEFELLTRLGENAFSKVDFKQGWTFIKHRKKAGLYRSGHKKFSFLWRSTQSAFVFHCVLVEQKFALIVYFVCFHHRFFACSSSISHAFIVCFSIRPSNIHCLYTVYLECVLC